MSSIDNEKQFLLECYNITEKEATDLLNRKNLQDAMKDLERRGFKADSEKIKEYNSIKQRDAHKKKDEMYVGSGQMVNKPLREHSLIFYTDGLLINGNFSKHTEEELEYFKEMIKNGQFDGQMLGDDNETGDFSIKYKDHPYEQNKPTEKKSPNARSLGGRRLIPKFFSLDRSENSIPLQFLFQDVIRTVHISKNSKVIELKELLQKYCKENKLKFQSEGVIIKENEKLHKYIDKNNQIMIE
ncbi:hypothetical protein M153_5780004615 [Pseudoloma neurophilia]|uniref:Uncharacterized protein n=1 Tax=Pseudoloma neurophilia TaxID=146866 RepID=A0A0R0M2W5_9MICR|nr:hypothetical protein M153_5780004615 [Pseudoloma neurophilia]